MSRGIYPTEVTTIVYSVKNIKSKKKDPKYCVLFSIGSVKYRSDLVEDLNGNPVFDTESVLQVESPKDPLILVATEKKEKEFYGQLIIPLNELETSRNGQIFRKLLEPHKKCSKPTAEIHFEAWISKVLNPLTVVSDIQTRKEIQPAEKTKKLSGLKKTLAGLVGTPKLSRKLLINRNNSFTESRKFSSCADLPAGNSNTLPCTTGSTFTLNNLKTPAINIIREENEEETDKDEDKSPQISGISPNFGPFQGGTKIIVRGERLGTCKQDIVGLFVCGSNVLSSLEYFSPSKIACTTKPWRPGEGSISVETQSGGKSKSSIKFNFEGEIEVKVDAPDSESIRRSESLKDILKNGDSKIGNFGTPQMGRVDRGFLGSKHLGVAGVAMSRSMLDLCSQGASNGKKPLHASNSSQLLLPNTNHKKGNGSRAPPIIQIQPMRMPESLFKSNKPSSKWGSGPDVSLIKDLQVELGDYQTTNSELRTKAHELEDENKRLKEYIENLLSRIMVKCPEMLCNDRK